MFRRTYKVKGEDVNDFMVMQDFAYHSYTSSILAAFLFEKGYSKHKLNALKIGLQKCDEELIYIKHLMFMQHFFLNLEFPDVTDNKQKINVRSRFFNVKNELCAMAITQLYWFDYDRCKIIEPPKNIFRIHTNLKPSAPHSGYVSRDGRSINPLS